MSSFDSIINVETFNHGRSLRLRGLRRGSWSLGYWYRGFESPSRHGCLSSSFCAVMSRGGSITVPHLSTINIHMFNYVVNLVT
jgi:hypothetical protein